MHKQAAVRYATMLVALAALACSADKVNSPTTGAITQWIVDEVVLPVDANSADQVGFDLDGDGTPDNQLGAVLSALIQASGSGGLDFQGAMDGAIASGAMVQLISFQSDDSLLASDAAASAHWYTGQPTAGFTTGAHVINSGIAAASFIGGLAARDFSSRDPSSTSSPVELMLPLKLFAAGAAINLPLNGVHVNWHFSSTTGIATGELQGSVREEDINTLFIPALAQAINAQIQADTASSTAHTLEGLFDDGGCAGAVANDGIITVCELATSSLIMTLLRSDLHVYNAAGAYSPSPTGTKNALSVGFGFTAVRTTF